MLLMSLLYCSSALNVLWSSFLWVELVFRWGGILAHIHTIDIIHRVSSRSAFIFISRVKHDLSLSSTRLYKFQMGRLCYWSLFYSTRRHQIFQAQLPSWVRWEINIHEPRMAFVCSYRAKLHMQSILKFTLNIKDDTFYKSSDVLSIQPSPVSFYSMPLTILLSIKEDWAINRN